MQKSIYFAKSLLVLSYALLYLFVFIIASVSIKDFLFQAVFNILFLIFVIFTQERLFAAFLQALGSFRVDSALRRIGGVAELVDNLHEYSELNDLLRYTQTSLSALMGGAGASIFVPETKVDNNNKQSIFLWSQQGLQKKEDMEKFLQFAKEMQRSFSEQECPAELTSVFEAYNAQIALPIFFGSKLVALILLRDPSSVYSELQELLAFFSRQLGVALERIANEQQKRQRKEQAFAEKSKALATLSATIAHEMRTPLSAVRASIGGVEAYLPELVDAYRYANAQDPETFPTIRPELLETLTESGPRVKSMVDQANHVIDLLLANLNDQEVDRRRFSIFPISECIGKAIQQYPFKRNERSKVSLDLSNDFSVLAEQSLLIYVLFNLLMNAFYSIESAGRGEIYIRLERGEFENILVFEDTGLGIDSATLPLIFSGFFTTRSNGTGAGLPFCRRTMQSFGGEIDVSSELGAYTRFTLEFPVESLNAKTLSDSERN